MFYKDHSVFYCIEKMATGDKGKSREKSDKAIQNSLGKNDNSKCEGKGQLISAYLFKGRTNKIS